MSDTAVIAWRVEMDFGSGWEDVSDDVVSDVKAEWGIKAGGPTDRCAEPGVMTFDLDNSSENAGGVRGYYSPGAAVAKAGFVHGIPVRLVWNHDLFGDVVKWVGTIKSVRPKPGAKDPIATVECVDWMEEAARAKLAGLGVQTDIQSDALFTMLVATVEKAPPGGTRVGSGSDVYPYALDNTQDERSKVLSEIQKLTMSEYGVAVVEAGVAVFEGRRGRGGAGSIRHAFYEDEDIIDLAVNSHDRDNVINRVQVSIHPRRRDSAATTVLFNLGSAMQILRGTSITINCPYRDPNQQAQRVGGVDMVAPVASTDYTFNVAKDGTGGDLTSQLTVVTRANADADPGTFGGNSTEVTITNNGPADGYIPANGFKLRGRGLYDFEPVVADRKDATSEAANGESVLGYDMPYQSSPENAVDLAQFILALNKDPEPRAQSVTWLANWSEDLAEMSFGLGISQRVSVTAASVGLSAEPYFVNGFSVSCRRGGLVLITAYLAPVSTAQFWILDIPGRTELDETTVLGYGLFIAGWVLDTSMLGTDTFLN